jgi:hypothetical protein
MPSWLNHSCAPQSRRLRPGHPTKFHSHQGIALRTANRHRYRPLSRTAQRLCAVTDGRPCARATTNDDYALSLLAGLVVIHRAFARAAVDALLLDFARRRRRAHTLCRLPLRRAGAQADQQHKPHDGPNRALSAQGHAAEYASACGCYGCDAPLHADARTHGERDAEPLAAPLLSSLPLGGYVPLASIFQAGADLWSGHGL